MSEALQVAEMLPVAELHAVTDMTRRHVALLPPGWKAESLAGMLPPPAPSYREAKVLCHTVDALVGYVARHRTGATSVWMDEPNARVVAVLDDGTEAAPGRRVHTACYAAELAPEFVEWVALTKAPVGQAALIAFIEDHDRHFVEPTGARMRTIANQLEVKKGVSFKNVEREDSAAADVSLVYETQTTELQSVKCPQSLRIRIPVFRQGAVYEIECRLRFDLQEGRLLFHLRMPEQAKIREMAWSQVAAELRERLAAGEPVVPVLEGRME